MVIIYKLLNILLILVYLRVFLNIKSSIYMLSPVFGFYIGIVYFILIPFSLLTYVEVFSLNSLSGVTGYWSTVDLNDRKFIFPYLFLWLTLMLTGLLMLILMKGNNNINNYQKIISQKNVINRTAFLLFISIMIQIIDWVIVIYTFGGISSYFNQHWYFRNEVLFSKYGSASIIIHKFLHANKIVFTGTSILFTLQFLLLKPRRKRIVNLFMISTVVVHLLIIVMSGNRIYFALYLIFIFFGMILLKLNKSVRAILYTLPFLVFIFSVWSYTRGMLNDFGTAFQNYIESFKENGNGLISMLFDITEGSNILASLHIIHDYGYIYNYLEGITYLKFVAPLFPDFIEKADSFTVIIGENYMPGTGVSLNSTIVGELYANFGLWTIFIIPLFFCLLLLISNWINIKTNPLLSVVFCSVTTWFVRSVFSDNMFSLIIGICILIGGLLVYKILVKISSKSNIK